MKIFEFDPETGMKGNVIHQVPIPVIRAHATKAQSPDHVEMAFPKDDAVWSTLKNASYHGLSYRRRTQWICFCTGKKEGKWFWYVLPSLKAYENHKGHTIPKCPPLFAKRVKPSNTIL